MKEVFSARAARSVPRYSFQEDVDENLTRAYNSWQFTYTTSSQLQLTKIVTALNFATLEMRLTIKTSEMRREDKDYAENVRNIKTSTLVTEKMMQFFSKLRQEGDEEITREEIGRQYRIGHQLAIAINSLGWSHVWHCTEISYNVMRDCNWKKDIVPYIIRESLKYFPEDRYE